MKHLAIATAVFLTLATSSLAQTAPHVEIPKGIETQVDAFFAKLKAGNADAAYTNLFDESMVKEKPQAISNLASQNATALRLYGGVIGWEPISRNYTSPYLIKIVYELRLERLPLFYNLTFYRKNDTAPW